MKVIIVFTYIEGLKEFSVVLKDVMEDFVGFLNVVVCVMLLVFNGYEFRELNGEFLFVFYSFNDVYKWVFFV